MKAILSVLTLASCLASGVFAQAFPSKPVRIIVPFPPGGVDVTARLLLPRMQEDLGQPVIIENRAGAGGVTGSLYVAKSPPDGYTVMMNASGPLIVAPFLSKNVPFDTVKDFTPITVLLQNTNLLLVKSSLPVNTVAELVEYAKKNPGKLSYASTGIGTNQHLDGELFKKAAGVDMVHVPYKGFGPALQDLIGGQVDLGFYVLTILKAMVGTGKFKLIAVSDAKRYSGLPGVPTIAETVPAFQKTPTWTGGVLGPAALPAPIVRRWHGALIKAVEVPEVRAKLEDSGAVVIANSPDEFAAMIRSDIEITGRAVKGVNIKIEE
jgi:tripartite-type tricarboxylate transporter receptor subunit TctC